MKTVEITTEYKAEIESYIALGNFDGVHLAHKKLLSTLVEMAKQDNKKSSILSFKNHTKNIINKKPQRLLTSTNQKHKKLSEIGINYCYEIYFDEEIMHMSAEDFVKKLLYENLKVRGIVVGFDYRFGYKAQGDINLLKILCDELNIKLIVIDEVIIDNNIVSSTLIRNLIEQGNMKEANRYLGYEFTIEGEVIHGKKLGSKMGIPTANIQINTNYVIPRFGVYDATIVIDNKEYSTATNIGKNPSIENSGLRIESHILDFSKDIYGEKINLILHNFIRDELKFDSIDDLFDQMEKDINNIRNSNIAKDK